MEWSFAPSIAPAHHTGATGVTAGVGEKASELAGLAHVVRHAESVQGIALDGFGNSAIRTRP